MIMDKGGWWNYGNYNMYTGWNAATMIRVEGEKSPTGIAKIVTTKYLLRRPAS